MVLLNRKGGGLFNRTTPVEGRGRSWIFDVWKFDAVLGTGNSSDFHFLGLFAEWRVSLLASLYWYFSHKLSCTRPSRGPTLVSGGPRSSSLNKTNCENKWELNFDKSSHLFNRCRHTFFASSIFFFLLRYSQLSYSSTCTFLSCVPEDSRRFSPMLRRETV